MGAGLPVGACVHVKTVACETCVACEDMCACETCVM